MPRERETETSVRELAGQPNGIINELLSALFSSEGPERESRETKPLMIFYLYSFVGSFSVAGNVGVFVAGPKAKSPVSYVRSWLIFVKPNSRGANKSSVAAAETTETERPFVSSFSSFSTFRFLFPLRPCHPPHPHPPPPRLFQPPVSQSTERGYFPFGNHRSATDGFPFRFPRFGSDLKKRKRDVRGNFLSEFYVVRLRKQKWLRTATSNSASLPPLERRIHRSFRIVGNEKRASNPGLFSFPASRFSADRERNDCLSAEESTENEAAKPISLVGACWMLVLQREFCCGRSSQASKQASSHGESMAAITVVIRGLRHATRRFICQNIVSLDPYPPIFISV